MGEPGVRAAALAIALVTVVVLGGDRAVGQISCTEHRIDGTEANDVLVGTPEFETLDGRGGDDQLFGLGGDDCLNGALGNDRLEGGDGDDDLDAGPGDDTLLGGPGTDNIVGRDGADLLDGGDGDDEFLQGDGGSDHILGGPGNDRLDGGEDTDPPADDRLEGGPGNDRIGTDTGDDLLLGQDGADVLAVTGGGGRLEGGDGDDRFGVESRGESFPRVTLDGGPGRDAFVLRDSFPTRLYGGPGNDVVNASNDRRDTIRCGPGRDRVLADSRDRLHDCERVLRLVPPYPVASPLVGRRSTTFTVRFRNTVTPPAGSYAGVRVIESAGSRGPRQRQRGSRIARGRTISFRVRPSMLRRGLRRWPRGWHSIEVVIIDPDPPRIVFQGSARFLVR